ncbi:MAG: hypothetical protein UY72_C0035G0006 [Candidatus Uhrbacteria bacterium GW2011_GWD2_52_7]|uniref:Uncharacterized protein n=1 Tax=Candidatus Uhrbacteria bacterium GW2011_GWD2_52_7 TaxID=1618989 RepID=A0A0G1XFJ5_9BACT|nr:MAG: hypothetical protein UY72_C0035G0006 [Candidatus Uhrbacteria bacterium GW2011_GWD2_52_7]
MSMNSFKKSSGILAFVGLVVVLIVIAKVDFSNSSSATESDNTVVADVTSADWIIVDAGPFTVSLPPTWTLQPRQGIDSYVADFVGDGIRLSSDFGWYSDSLAEVGDPKYSVTYEAIDGQNAKLVVPKVMGNGLTGVYFEGLGNNGLNRLQISGDDLTAEQQELVVRIFKTIRFTHPSQQLLPE